MITNHEYHVELLGEVLAEYLEKNTNAKGVYIGELNHPPR
jgi:hypothetical protein